jgi:starch phosphorylase
MVLGQFLMNSFGTADLMREILESICFGNDWYGVTFDFDSYVAIQKKVDEVWRDPEEWTRRSIMSTAGMGCFSSDVA